VRADGRVAYVERDGDHELMTARTGTRLNPA
jgi:hypothetical protein